MEDEELKKIVTNMVSAGESEENIALVIRNYKPKQAVDTATVQQPPQEQEAPQAAPAPQSTNDTGFLSGVGNAIKAYPSVAAAIELGKTAVSGTVGFAKSAWNTAVNQQPKEFRLEDLRNSQGTFKDYLDPSGANIQSTKFDFPEANELRHQYTQWINRQPHAIRSMPNDQRADVFLKQSIGEKKVNELTSKFNKQLSDYRVGILDDVERQNSESESLMEGETQSVRDIKTGSDFGSYLGTLGGQGVGRIVGSILTGGAGSIIAERSAGYEGQLDKMAKLASYKTGISEENAKKAIIKLNIDNPEAGRILSDIAGTIDIVSIPVMGASKVWGKVAPLIFEMATEIGQSEIEEKVASMGAGTDYEYDPVRSIDSGLGAVFGAKATQVVTSAIQNVTNTGDPKINKEIDNAAGLTPAEAEQLGVKTPPPSSPPVQEVTTQPLNTTTDAVQEQETGSVLQREQETTGEEGSERGGMEQSQQGQETTGEVSEEEKVKEETDFQEKLKAKRKTLQDKVNDLHTEWISGGEESMPDDLRQAKKNLDAFDNLAKQREERLAEEKPKGKQNPGNTPDTPVTGKVAGNPRYKAQKAVVDQAYNDALVDGQYDMEKLEVARKEAEKLNDITKDLMQKQEVSGEKAASEPVVSTIAKLRKEFYANMKAGAKYSSVAFKELLTKITDTAKEHKLTPRQITTLVNLVKRTNLDKKRHHDKFNAKVAQIATKADYAEQLDTAERLRTQIRKKSTGSLADKVHNAARSFAKVEPGDLDTKELGAYIGHASDLVNHYKNVASKVQEPASAVDIQSFSDQVNARQRADQIQDVRDEFGFEEDKVSDLEIAEYLKNEEEGKEQEDPFSKNKSDTDRKIIRDNLLETAEYAQVGMEEALKDGKFDGEHKEKATRISQIDLSKLNNKQLADFVRNVQKMVKNDDFSGTDKMDSMAKAVENSVELAENNKGHKLKETNWLERNAYSLPLLYKAIHGLSGYAAEAYRLSGIGEYFNASGRVENRMHKQDKAFLEKSKKLRRKDKTNFDKAITQVDAGVFATLVRHPKGVDPVKAFNEAKANVVSSIAAYKNSKDENHQAMGRDAEIAFEKFKNAKSIEEVFTIMENTKKSQGAYEMWKFWRDSNKEKVNTELKKITEEYHNKPYIEQENYTKGMVLNFKQQGVEQLGEGGGSNQTISEQKQSTTSMPPTGFLGPDQAIDFNFYANNRRGFKESVESIEMTKPKQVLREFLMLPNSGELLGGEKNRQALIGSLKRSDAIADSFGGGFGDQVLNNVSHALKQHAVQKALGGFTQFAKQFYSVGIGSMSRLGTDSDLLITTKIDKAADALFDQYPIANRGNRLAGTEESYAGHGTRAAYENRLLKVSQGLNDLYTKGAHIWLTSLREGDVRIAKRAWAAYYLSSLKAQGIDIKHIKLSDEATLQGQVERQKAAAYATQVVNETQLSSNPAEMARLLKTKPGVETAVKDILIPFSSFSINSKMRGIAAADAILRNPTRAEPWKEFGAILSEMLLYNAIKTFLLETMTTTLLKPAIEAMFGIEGEEKDEEEVTDMQARKFWSGVIKDASPLAIGSEGTSFTIQGVNWLNYLYNNPDISYREWKDKKQEYFTNYVPQGVDYGVYDITGQAIDNTGQDLTIMYDIANENNIYVQNQWGGRDRVALDDDQKNFMLGNMIFENLSNSTGIDADVYNTFQRIKREQIKKGKKAAADYDAKHGIVRSPYE